jgi:hypothetical protein
MQTKRGIYHPTYDTTHGYLWSTACPGTNQIVSIIIPIFRGEIKGLGCEIISGDMMTSDVHMVDNNCIKSTTYMLNTDPDTGFAPTGKSNTTNQR